MKPAVRRPSRPARATSAARPQHWRLTWAAGAGVVIGAALVMFTCLGDGNRSGAPAPAAKFDGARAWEHLRRQVGFGPRPPGSPELARTRAYIIEQLRASGIDAREQRFEASTPIGPIAMANVVATIRGARPERIALASHYDTKLAPSFRFVGAEDGGSSTAALLEIGRALSSRANPFTIELLFFDGEEAINWDWKDYDNTYGSRHYVEQAESDGTLAGLKALILLDMVGDRDLRFRRDANSTEWMTAAVWAAAAQLGHRAHFPEEDFAIDDDHSAFLRAGVPAVDIIDLDYARWHSARDDLQAVSQQSLQVTGDVVLAALPRIEQRLLQP
jgi:glutaminyl-peptide cyclotransferase